MAIIIINHVIQICHYSFISNQSVGPDQGQMMCKIFCVT